MVEKPLTQAFVQSPIKPELPVLDLKTCLASVALCSSLLRREVRHVAEIQALLALSVCYKAHTTPTSSSWNCSPPTMERDSMHGWLLICLSAVNTLQSITA